MNALVFEHCFYRETISHVLAEAISKYETCSPDLKWEMIKTEVISISKACSHHMKHSQTDQIARLDRTLDYFQNQVINTSDPIFAKELKLV